MASPRPTCSFSYTSATVVIGLMEAYCDDPSVCLGGSLASCSAAPPAYGRRCAVPFQSPLRLAGGAPLPLALPRPLELLLYPEHTIAYRVPPP